MDKINQESLFKVHGEEYKKNFPKIQINEDRPLIRSPTEDDKNGRSALIQIKKEMRGKIRLLEPGEEDLI